MQTHEGRRGSLTHSRPGPLGAASRCCGWGARAVRPWARQRPEPVRPLSVRPTLAAPAGPPGSQPTPWGSTRTGV